ncbi:MAG: hypothetical protein MUP27_05880, partial [Desulfobacterales bacterium]|nr:hypothetical protein [Desulfobacterales bacterium]
LLVVLNVRKTELHVKQKRPQDMVSFLKSSGRQPDKKFSQWDKGTKRGLSGAMPVPHPSIGANMIAGTKW